MNNRVDFYSFYNDFNVSNINCVDLTNATYLGRKNTNLYYFYCFLFVLFSNFNCSDLSAREATFKSLGLVENFKKVNNFDDLKNEIIKGIDNDEPLMVYFKYRSLFYYKNYKNLKERKYTALICNEYNDNTQTISILDMIITRKNLYSIFTGEFYSILPLTYNMFEEMWNLSKSNFKEDYQEKFIDFNAYSLKTIKEPDFSSMNEIVKYFIDVISQKEDKLIKEIKTFNNRLPTISKGYTEALMQKYGISMFVITETLRKYFFKQFVDDLDFYNFLHSYYKNRRSYILKISKNVIRRKPLTKNEIDYYVAELSSENQKLLDWVNKYFSQNNSNLSKYINFTYHASIFADTELRPVKVLLNDNSMNESHYWVSHKTGNIHWLKLDLHSIKKVKCILIKHYGEAQLNTKEFILYGSVEDENWTEIVHENNNQKNISLYDIDNNFRYLKLEILVPCEKDYYARIKEFSVYGEIEDEI